MDILESGTNKFHNQQIWKDWNYRFEQCYFEGAKIFKYDGSLYVCIPQVFMGARFMERETQFRLLDGFLFQPKNVKRKRNLIVTVAASEWVSRPLSMSFAGVLLTVVSRSHKIPESLDRTSEKP